MPDWATVKEAIAKVYATDLEVPAEEVTSFYHDLFGLNVRDSSVTFYLLLHLDRAFAQLDEYLTDFSNTHASYVPARYCLEVSWLASAELFAALRPFVPTKAASPVPTGLGAETANWRSLGLRLVALRTDCLRRWPDIGLTSRATDEILTVADCTLARFIALAAIVCLMNAACDVAGELGRPDDIGLIGYFVAGYIEAHLAGLSSHERARLGYG